MKKILLFAIIAIIIMIMLAGCNRQLIDTTYSFNKAYIAMPNGEVISGKVESWRDYEDGDQLQIRINGKTYLTSAVNVVLISE